MDEKSTTQPGHAAGHTGGTTILDHAGMQQGTGGSAGSVNQTMEQARTTANQTMGQAMGQAKAMARNIGEQARAAMDDPGAAAQELARRAREQAGAAGDVLYRQGQRAGEYLSQNVNEYPLAALFIAGMIGYGLAYLIHSQWQAQMSWPRRD